MSSQQDIEVIDVSKDYSVRGGVIHAIDRLRFSVSSGEFVTILGPSGCGKTTILKIIAGLNSATSGEVRIDNQTVMGPRRDVGIVFQTPALMRWRTVLQNVLLPQEILGLDRKSLEARAHELIDLVGLAKFADRRPAELSGGMLQRVGIARALVHDPKILLLDEPFSALDAMTRNQLNIELLRIWSQRKKTSVLITHSIPEAVFLSDRVVVLTQRPSRVAEIVDIPLPRPRTPKMRTSVPFIKMVDHLGGLIGLEFV